MISDHPNVNEVNILGSNIAQETSEEFNRIIELLEFEITQIRTEESQPGWTTWALLGGLATTLWLFALEIENHGANLQTTLFLFLVFSLTLDTLKLLHRLISPSSSFLKSAFRFQSAYSQLSQTRASILLDIARSVVLILTARIFGPFVSSPFIIAISQYRTKNDL